MYCTVLLLLSFAPTPPRQPASPRPACGDRLFLGSLSIRPNGLIEPCPLACAGFLGGVRAALRNFNLSLLKDFGQAVRLKMISIAILYT